MADRADILESSNRPRGHERPLRYPKEPQVEVIPEQEQQEPIRVSIRGTGSRNQGPMEYPTGANVQLAPEGVEVHENPIFELNEVSQQEHWGPQIRGHDQGNDRTRYYGQNVQRPHRNNQFGYSGCPRRHTSTGPPPQRRQEPPNYWEN